MLPIRTCIILLSMYPATAFQRPAFFQRQCTIINKSKHNPLHICSRFLYNLKYVYKDDVVYYGTKVSQIKGSVKMISSTVAAMKGAFTRKQAVVVKEGGAIPRPEVMMVCNSRVYRAEELRDYDFAYFYGCANIKHAIAKKEITDADYLFAYEKKGEWVSSHTGYNKAKLFFKEQWVLSHVPKLMPAIGSSLAATPDPDSAEDAKAGPTETRYEEAPPILVLKQTEKFKDVNGRIVEIEVRGERAHDLIFFKVKDVSASFEMPNLGISILNNAGEYYVNNDYKTFITTRLINLEKTDNRNTNTAKELFLTYKGMLRVLFCSRSGSANLFVDWATRKLFAVHLGTAQQKAALAAELMGPDVKYVKQVIGASSSPLPAIYLFCIGRASALLPDSGDKYAADDFIYKFGYTGDIKRRTQEHAKTFAEEFGASITLPMFSVIDTYYLSEAESWIARHFDGLDAKLEYKNYDELVVLNKKKLANTADVYKTIQRNYAGDKAAELLAAKKEMEDAAHRKEVDTLKREREMDNKRYEMECKQREAEREMEIKKHEMEKTMMQNEREMEKAKFQHEREMDRKEHALGMANAKIETLECEKVLLKRENILLERENQVLRGVVPVSV